MNVNCSTCLDLLTPSCELSSAPCGHVFHSNCIAKWLETGKDNCPQCRTKCKINQLRRIYFTEGVEATTGSQLDTNVLQNRLDSLTFQVRCSDAEKKKLQDQVNELTAHKLAIKDDFKALEKKYNNNKDDCASYRNQVKILQGEKQRSKDAMRKAAELEEKLKKFETIEVSLKGTLPQMMDRLHSLNDYSDNARQLCEVAEQLKKELINKGSDVKQLAKSLQQKTNECITLKSKKDENVVKVNELTLANKKLTEDMDHIEEENNDLRTKLSKLQEAIASPSGDAKSSAIARFISENPAPNNSILGNSPPTPKTTVKSCGIVGLNRKNAQERSPCKNISNSLKRSMSSQLASEQATSLFSKKNKVSYSQPQPDTFYNGLGGHSKDDAFPSARPTGSNLTGSTSAAYKVSKKPKGVSRPKVDQKMKTINKYFNFDTP